ncbi:MAG TPA: fused MFS/spermidine synthase [Thermoanaerobaculia bacterium]|nr:fused MFS/spermidine synthase [Thermoanaerobaculia bacterium]
MTRTWRVALLLFSSGLCALVYQMVWMREFRLVFGASTGATAAVLAIFMGGLGIGSALFGKRADARALPLGLYANLEFAIALSAAMSVPLLWLVRQLYLGMGGSVQLGLVAATVMRLLLAVLVLAIPTLAMGGTLPAAARAVETASDTARRHLALLYGMNTLGAVAGALLSTFFLLETFGNRRTLMIAALLNLLVAVVARSMSRQDAGAPVASPAPAPSTGTDDHTRPPRTLILATAAIAGSAFLLMELVWYRMLGPLLGGTTFTFGLILAMALAGIGAGGLAYSAWNRATLGGLALTSALEALAVIVPFAAGDRIAFLANILRRLGDFGFAGHVMGWSAVTFIVVFPAAFIAGFQFPLLIALLGRGSENVGKHVGLAYAWNTFGAIAGSIAGGFGLLPLLSAPGAWRAVTVILASVAASLALFALRDRQRVIPIASILVAAVALTAVAARGPTAVWRHSGIGVGRFETPDSINDYRLTTNHNRRRVIWDADGRESGVALVGGDDLAMIVNGKSDGSAVGDAGTQVMGGLLGALLHPNAQTSLVVGLGTGSTAGWLASVPSMKRVDVVELEPVVLRVAEACALVNQNVLSRRNVHLRVADAREVLIATPGRYDLIISEPSNPYRAGIASLFTTEFYREASNRLRPGGMFLQWTQTYDIDASTLRTIYGTLTGVFPYVQTYWTTYGDLMLVATREPVAYDADRLRGLLGAEPYRTAVQQAWRVATLEGFLAHFIANEEMARLLASQADAINTDDRTVIEFSFARAVSARRASIMGALIAEARHRGHNRPSLIRGPVDWRAVDANLLTATLLPVPPDLGSPENGARHQFSVAHESGDLSGAVAQWRAGGWRPVNISELSAAAESLADAGDEAGAVAHVQNLARFQPAEASAVMARLRMRQQRYAEAASHLDDAFARYQAAPWPSRQTMRRALETAIAVAEAAEEHAPALYERLMKPFATGQLEHGRLATLVTLGMTIERCGPRAVQALRQLEPHVPWQREPLLLRRQCYARANLGSLAERAADDYEEFERAEPETLIRTKD